MGVLIEENGKYCLNCDAAVWATDEIHNLYAEIQYSLSDVDFILETEDKLLMIEYKNALIEGAAHPEAFRPGSDKKISSIVKKFYDSLHYLTLREKIKPKEYIYILEYPNGDSVTRKGLRNIIREKLPFNMQNSLSSSIRLIDGFAVLSIEEWNEHSEYGKYPIHPVC